MDICGTPPSFFVGFEPNLVKRCYNEIMQEQKQLLSMKRAGEALGIRTHTVRRYCNQGLVPHVRRGRNGYRMLEDWQIEWLKTLVFLERCGFNKKELKKYVSLCRKGGATLGERKEMLATKKRQMWQKIEDLQENIDFVERREEIFERVRLGESELETDWY